MEICQADLRCLDAHSHLGILTFDSPQRAIRHFEVGLPHWRIVTRPELRWPAALGAHRQSAVSALPARLRPVPVATETIRGSRTCL